MLGDGLNASFTVLRPVPSVPDRRPARKGATMTSDPDHVRDEEIVTDQRDAGDVTDQAEAEAALSGPGDTGVMMDAADSGTLDQSDVPTPSGASDTGAMMDSRDTGTLDRTDVGERGDADADESDR